MYRNHNCGELNIKNVNEEVMLAGWVQRIRNLGSMQFVDLRDEKGITQIVITTDELKEQMENVNPESVISVTGTVVERSNKNPKMPTGEIEIEAKKIEVLGKCKSTLPFEINSEKIDIENVREDFISYAQMLQSEEPVDKILDEILIKNGISSGESIKKLISKELPANQKERIDNALYALACAYSYNKINYKAPNEIIRDKIKEMSIR